MKKSTAGMMPGFRIWKIALAKLLMCWDKKARLEILAGFSLAPYVNSSHQWRQ